MPRRSSALAPATAAVTRTAMATWMPRRTGFRMTRPATGSAATRPTEARSGPDVMNRPASGVSPGEDEPCERGGPVDESEPQRVVPEREHRHGEREGQSETVVREARALRPAAASASGQPAGKNGRAAALQAAKSTAAPAGTTCEPQRAGGIARPLRSPAADAAGPERPCGAGRRARARTVAASGRRLSARSTHSTTAGSRSGRMEASDGAPSSIRRAVSSSEPPQNGCRPASASQSSTPTAQTSAAGPGGLAAQPLGRDVRERAGDVADGRQRLVLVHHRQAEVEELHAHVRAVREQDVRGLDVAVDDAVGVRVRQAVEDLRACLDRCLVVQVASRGSPRASVSARDVLVDDVDVAGIASERVRSQAALVPELGGRARLALGAGSGVAVAGDDLQRDVGAALGFHGEPHGARAARAEGSDRPVSPEHERSRGDCCGRPRHQHRPLWPCGGS